MDAAFFRVYSDNAGYLAIMARPQQLSGYPESIETLAVAGIGQVVSLLESAESTMLGLDAESSTVIANGMTFVSFPIADFGVPSSVQKFAEQSAELFRQLKSGTNVLIHCRGGVGRSGLMAAGVMLQAGFEPEQAFTRITKSRGVRVPETPAQREWLITNYETIVAC